jgi:hypothetical protein
MSAFLKVLGSEKLYPSPPASENYSTFLPFQIAISISQPPYFLFSSTFLHTFYTFTHYFLLIFPGSSNFLRPSFPSLHPPPPPKEKSHTGTLISIPSPRPVGIDFCHIQPRVGQGAWGQPGGTGDPQFQQLAVKVYEESTLVAGVVDGNNSWELLRLNCCCTSFAANSPPPRPNTQHIPANTNPLLQQRAYLKNLIVTKHSPVSPCC